MYSIQKKASRICAVFDFAGSDGSRHNLTQMAIKRPELAFFCFLLNFDVKKRHETGYDANILGTDNQLHTKKRVHGNRKNGALFGVIKN